jgi:hypothetical protein
MFTTPLSTPRLLDNIAAEIDVAAAGELPEGDALLVVRLPHGLKASDLHCREASWAVVSVASTARQRRRNAMPSEG